MVAEMNTGSSNSGSEAKRKLTESKQLRETVIPAKRRCLEPSPQLNENALAQARTTSTRGTVNIESSSCDDIIASLHQEHLDIFNADDDRQELIDYCEIMLEDCKNKTSVKTKFPTSRQELHKDDFADDLNDTDSRYDSFDYTLRHAVGDQQLKSAYYFDGIRFVAIQVITDSNSGECQLILPMDHPHYLGVPEEVPIFETRSVAIEELTHR